jgi:predicted aspartyl protease
MKNLSITIIFLGMLIIPACSNPGYNDPDVDGQLAVNLWEKNFLKLRNELESAQGKLSEERMLYYQTYCEQAFGNSEKSNEYADILLSRYKKRLKDSVKAEILGVKSNNYIREFRYKDAVAIYNTLLDKYRKELDSIEADDYRNVMNLFGTVAHVDPQLIHIDQDVKIAAYRNQFNHLMAPVKCGGVEDEFIFDTGANISSVSESCAKKMNLKVLESDVKVGTSTSIDVQTKLAVADSLYVGDILFENVIFLVVNDEEFNFPSVNYQIHGIVGFPVICQMGEIQMCREGTIIVPKEPQKRMLANMFLYGLNPVVQLISEGDTLLVNLDTGARGSELSKKYYEDNKEYVETLGELGSSGHGGAGGFVDIQEYRLKNFHFAVGSKSGVLPEIPVVLKKFDFNKYFDGNLGQDVFMQFSKMILNFKYMYLDFE